MNAPATDPHGEVEHARSLAESLEVGAALVDLSHRTVLRLTGKDPTGMLNATLTNAVSQEENLGAYAALLNPKGRIQTDLRVLKNGKDILIDTEPEGVQAARDILGRYAPFSRVKLENLSDTWGVLGLYGPRVEELLGGLMLAEHESAEVEIGGGAKLLAAGVAVPVSGLDLVGPTDALRAARKHLLEAGAVPASPESYETVRVQAGIPRFGTDITTENFPGESESFLKRAVSFQKGCYPGQETVARMYYRGHPNKKLYRLIVEGHPPKIGGEIVQDEKEVGWISSVAPLPMNDRTFALGYLRRSANTDAPLSTGEATLLLADGEKV